MPCDARSFCDLFKRKGPTQRLKTAKKSFLRPLWTPNPNFWYLIFGQFFFSSKYGHVGCPERCHVIPGLSATFSNGRDPLRGSKRQKSRFYGHYGPQIPIFGTSFSANFFFSSKYGHVGCPERCHVIPGLSATLSNAREPTQRLKTAKKSFLRSFWTLNPNFLAIMSH